MHSCIFSGQVKHSRLGPVAHAFRYRLFMMYLDLEELPQLFRGRWFWSTSRPALARFRRENYLGDPGVPLDQAVRAKHDLAFGNVESERFACVTGLCEHVIRIVEGLENGIEDRSCRRVGPPLDRLLCLFVVEPRM